MPAITLAQAQAQLNASLDALLKAKKAQSYSASSGSSTRGAVRADLAKLQADVEFWEAKVNQLSSTPSGGIKIYSGVPVDY